MTSTRLIAWLRGLHRGYKFAILLVAAWAPFIFPNHPLMTWALMALMTILFFIATGRGKLVARTEPSVAHEKADVEP
jgi:Sec-independent protein secretion pathway component TatC